MSGSLAATIQAAIQFGAAQAASVLGTNYSQYRPSGPTDPISSANLIQTLPAIFTADQSGQTIRPASLGKVDWWALVNMAQTKPSDYLVGTPNANGPGDIDTWFITTQYPDQPMAGVIKCTNTFNVLRPTGNTSYGTQPYGGDIVGDETPILTAFPGALMQGTKGEKADSILPGDVRMPWYYIFLPSVLSSGAIVQIMAADVITDDYGRRYKVSSCELSPTGWRLSAILAQT